MECAQSAGIDLPLKALAWEDASGQVWLGYNDPQFLAARHGAKDCAAAAGLRKALDGLAGAATESTEEHRENKCLHSLVTLTCLVRGTIAPTC